MIEPSGLARFGSVILDRPGVTAAEVRAEVRRRIDELAAGGGYIAAPSHGVPYKQELIDAMNDEIRLYGCSFYEKTENTPNEHKREGCR